MQTLIIVNRHAGSMRRDPTLAARMRAICGGDATLQVTTDTAELASAAAAAAQAGVRAVGIVGGDGTASATLTALWRAYGQQALPRVTFLRGGTMNTIASSLGISHESPCELLRRAMQRLRHPNGTSDLVRPAMVIEDGRAESRLGFLFGTGIWYGYIAESYAGGQPSRWTNATVLGRAVASAVVRGRTFTRMVQSRRVSVRHAGGTWETQPYLTVAAGTVAHAGFGFRPFHRAFATDEHFQLLAVRGSPGAVLQDLPGLWLGRGLRDSTAHDTLTPWAELASVDGPFGYSVDGDVATAQDTLRLSLGPLFRFLRI